MPDPLLKRCLDAISRAGTDEAEWSILQAYRHDLLSNAAIGVELAVTIGTARELQDFEIELKVLESLIGEARMDRENAAVEGAAVLSALDDAILDLADRRAMTRTGTFLLGRCYVRAGLDAPEHLRRFAAREAADSGSLGDLPDLDELLDRLRKDAEGDAYSVHATLNEMLATVDREACGILIGEVVGREGPFFERLGCYWLLDGAGDRRLAAANTFLRNAQTGRLDAAITFRLIEMRNWLPADAGRDVLDWTIREALRREAAGGAPPTPWTLHRVLATVPDGAGAQSFAIAVQQHGRRCIAMVLLKQGLGVRDAYILPCRSATEQRRILAQFEEETDALEVTMEILAPALAGALTEGHAVGAPPAHGLVDVVEVCGLRELRPAPMSVGDWIAYLDPEGDISRLSPQKLGRLVSSSADWPDDYDLVQSWFEDSAAVREILTEAITRRSREGLLWQHLETRRDWWARLIAKTAAVLKAEEGGFEEDWTAFAATALALSKGRPLRKVPIMSWIVAESLDCSGGPRASPRHDRDDAGHPVPDEGDMPADFAPPAPERQGELKRLLKAASMEITPEWVDGYLAAIILAPKLVAPSEWVSGFLEQKHNFTDHGQVQRFLDLVLFRYNAANADMAEAGVIRAKISAYDDRPLRGWAEGFTRSVRRHKGGWAGKSVTGQDKKILRLIADIAKGSADPSELQPLLPAWLTHRHATRR